MAGEESKMWRFRMCLNLDCYTYYVSNNLSWHVILMVTTKKMRKESEHIITENHQVTEEESKRRKQQKNYQRVTK